VPAAVGRARRGREQGRHQRPELVRYEVVSKGCHGAGSCQTNPKGTKRRLSAGRAASGLGVGRWSGDLGRLQDDLVAMRSSWRTRRFLYASLC
jgi:hypothetical protein